MMVNDTRVSTREVSEVRFVYGAASTAVGHYQAPPSALTYSGFEYFDVAWWRDRSPVLTYADVPDVGHSIVMPGMPGGRQHPCRIVDHVWMPNDDTLTWTVYVVLGPMDGNLMTHDHPPAASDRRSTLVPE